MAALCSFRWSILLAVAACSGAEKQDVLAGEGSSSGLTSNGTSSSSGSISSSSTSTSGSSSSGQPAGDCVAEEEPNDRKEQANVLAPARCGSINKSDQRDFLTFTMQPTTKTMSLNFSGRVRLKVDVGNRTIELTPDNAGVVPFVMGTPYLIEVTALSGGSTDAQWRVAVIEK